MRADTRLYPSLGRYFRTSAELADAACMKRNRLYHILRGDKEFTEQEKKAIANSVIGKMIAGEIDDTELDQMVEAREDFDKVFKTKE